VSGPAPDHGAIHARFLGTGSALGPCTQTNEEVAERLDTTPEWIAERTGIEARRMGGTTSSLATEAAVAALEDAGVDGADVGVVVVATCTPDLVFPSVASAVAGGTGARGATFDVNGACAGFVHALASALAWSAIDGRPALVVGADTITEVTDPDNRATAVLFGDGAGALVVRADPTSPGGLLALEGATDPTARDILRCERGSTIEMDGRAVFEFAVEAGSGSITEVARRAAVDPADVDLVVPHQSNERIMEAVAERVGIAADRVVSTLRHTGNTSSGTIPHALATARADGRVAPGDLVVLCGYGAGMTRAAALLRWAE
jgi:3-oxoacyl-[acyl-carrier-protein] synthase-3